MCDYGATKSAQKSMRHLIVPEERGSRMRTLRQEAQAGERTYAAQILTSERQPWPCWWPRHSSYSAKILPTKSRGLGLTSEIEFKRGFINLAAVI